MKIVDESIIVDVLTHEYIHWILHKRICEDACGLLDRIPLSEYTLR